MAFPIPIYRRISVLRRKTAGSPLVFTQFTDSESPR